MEQHEEIINNYFDRMTESSFSDLDSTKEIFKTRERRLTNKFNIHEDESLLEELNNDLGLALNDHEKKYLQDLFTKLNRPVTDADL